MATVKTSGSQAATIGTEHVLITITDPGVYSFVLDSAPMNADDVLELRIYGKCRSTDAERIMDFFSLAGPQQKALKLSVAWISPHYFKVTLMQRAGTGHTYNWAVYQT